MSKKRMFIGIIILCLMTVAIFCINDYRHQECYHDIEKIVSECIKGNIDINAIDSEAGKKLYDYVQDMYKEYDGLDVKEAEGLWDEADWNKKTVWINETFSGKLKNSSKSEKTENAESFKIFFIIKNGNVYIKKAGVSVSEEGEYISDLDK